MAGFADQPAVPRAPAGKGVCRYSARIVTMANRRDSREDDVVRNRLAFTLFSYWHFRRPIQAGEYYFDQPVNTREVFWKMVRGRIYIRTILVPEGWTSFDIAEEIQEQGICDRNQLLAAAHERSLNSNIAPQAHSLEGFLFPSTYEFTPDHNSCEESAKTNGWKFQGGVGVDQAG